MEEETKGLCLGIITKKSEVEKNQLNKHKENSNSSNNKE